MIYNKFNYKSFSELQEQLDLFNLSLPFVHDKSEVRDILSKPLVISSKRSGGKQRNINNRIAIQPMEGFDSEDGGQPSELTKRRYDRFAKSGAGLIWYEATAVVVEGRSNAHQLYIEKSNVDYFSQQVEEIKKTCMKNHGFEPLIIMQATHSGRYSKPLPVIAYQKPLFEKDNPIDPARIISADELKYLTDKMGEAAKLACQAGFDGVDIKCCHGYLNNELLSAYNRTDEYGGSFENRIRFFSDSVKAAQSQTDTNNFIVTSRMNAYDGFAYPNGFGVADNGSAEPDLTETKKLISVLHHDLNISLLDITIGNPYVNPHVNRPADTLPYEHTESSLAGIARVAAVTAELQKEFPGLPIIASAMTYLRQFSPNYAAAMVKNGSCAMAGFGRMAFAYPEFARDILDNGEITGEKCCITCGNCSLLMRNQSSTGCVIRDREKYYPLYKKYVLKED